MNISIIIPTTRGKKSLDTISSALNQIGFDNIFIIITGKSTLDQDFLNKLNIKFSKNNIYIAKGKDKKVILPGEARNDGLRYISNNDINSEFILFLDDDIVIPKDYCSILVNCLQMNDSSASIGRVISIPVNFWTKIIDYSNFWWLQTDKNNNKMKWISTTATLTKEEYIEDIYFNEDVEVNEDSSFFDKILRGTGKLFTVCAETSAEHHHSRNSFSTVINYQFNNGRKSVFYHWNIFNIFAPIHCLFFNYYKTLTVNKKYLSQNKLVATGVFLSFLVYTIGLEYGSFFSSLRKLKNLFK